ncbi:MAG: ATP-binding protein [Rhodocyclaceae bacterium]|nr:ATP-binding protein [Rhodocyclaceae bacterium]MCA3134444.1 ATP-binding protein [Rhodocyclaceae bacterium]MCA3144991.1 ATP-binding protein [Rhodocyclaceae bacterium]
MIARRLKPFVLDCLASAPAVVLLGPRQVGKTTLAREIAGERGGLYLDLESPADRGKLADPELYLAQHADKLVVLDEVHRAPGLFPALRGLIDQSRRQGHAAGRFLLLGSAALHVLRQSGESLAGRVAYLELAPFQVSEVEPSVERDLWVRGGFPDSLLARDGPRSLQWRRNFIRTYLERDIPQFGPRVPAETLRRFWTMLAHGQGTLLNVAEIARSLAVDGKTVARYLDLLVDLLLVRRLAPYHVNVGKRLVKAPKVYVRDSGLAHALLGIGDHEALLGHPVAAASWEGFVIENLIAAAGPDTVPGFYRTSAGAEIDLVLERPGGERWVVEIKRSSAPTLSRGFHSAREDLKPGRSFVVYAGTERYPVAQGVEAIGPRELAGVLASSSG